MKVLLDTCTLLWIAIEDQVLSRDAIEAFRQPANDVYLSVVSAWEIAVKHGLGKLHLTEPASRLLPSLRQRYDLWSLPLDEESALEIERLPELHRDPFDRMLVCQALVHGLVILTPDELVRQYPVRTLW